MKISVEITLMPLNDDYKEHIKDFIQVLKSSEFKVLETPLSTQVFGDYDKVMPFLTDTIEQSFSGQEKVMVNLKLFKGNRS